MDYISSSDESYIKRGSEYDHIPKPRFLRALSICHEFYRYKSINVFFVQFLIFYNRILVFHAYYVIQIINFIKASRKLLLNEFI